MTHARPQTDGSCCNGTGFADYAAVPCPNPHCPVPQPPPEPLPAYGRRTLTPEVKRKCQAALAATSERLDLVLAYLQAAGQITECEVLEGLRRGLAAFNRDHIGESP